MSRTQSKVTQHMKNQENFSLLKNSLSPSFIAGLLAMKYFNLSSSDNIFIPLLYFP